VRSARAADIHLAHSLQSAQLFGEPVRYFPNAADTDRYALGTRSLESLRSPQGYRYPVSFVGTVNPGFKMVRERIQFLTALRERLRREAVQLYMNRITDDGILALHISNKYVSLEPVVAQITSDLGLTARLWSDNLERGRPGKTASSWVVVAKDVKTLGTLGLPAEEQQARGRPDLDGLLAADAHLARRADGHVAQLFERVAAA